MPPKNKIKLKSTRQMLPIQLTVLGNGAGGPFQGRHYTDQSLKFDNQHFLIDCSESTQMQMHRYGIPFERIRQVFISYLHGDHIFGLAGLLAAYPAHKHSYKVEIFSPRLARQKRVKL
jgi:ribonuclease Z